MSSIGGRRPWRPVSTTDGGRGASLDGRRGRWWGGERMGDRLDRWGRVMGPLGGRYGQVVWRSTGGVRSLPAP
jgi:hypothetical protein